jgi:hypothetical protein
MTAKTQDETNARSDGPKTEVPDDHKHHPPTRSFGVRWKTDDRGKNLHYKVYREQDINKNTSVEKLPGRPMMRHQCIVVEF